MVKLCDVLCVAFLICCSLRDAGVVGFDLMCSGKPVSEGDGEFDQKSDRFLQYDEELSSWVELKLPFDLLSCHNENCTKVGTLHQTVKNKGKENGDAVGRLQTKIDGTNVKEKINGVGRSLPWWKRVSLTKMSETSIWITGASGSVYERYWNGLQWVIAPYNLPASVGRAVSIFVINQTIMALSEAGSLYQLQLSENLQPVWLEFIPLSDATAISNEEAYREAKTKIKSGINSVDGQRFYFCMTDGSLIELTEMHPRRWVKHGRPSGSDVAAIANPAAISPETVFTISSSGDLYEYVSSSKPSWKKHIWVQGSAQNITLQATTGCSVHGLRGAHSMSLFLLTRDGNLIERLLYQRKWKWLDHGSPKDQFLKAIMPLPQTPADSILFSIFCTTTAGHVLEYRIRKQPGTNQENKAEQTWVSHKHPKHAKPVTDALGVQLHAGRMFFALDDGRLAELHLRGIGGETSGPYTQVPAKKKVSQEYIWSILETPETEGWNAEYCSGERGPLNCVMGTKDESGLTYKIDRRKNGNNDRQTYLPPKALDRKTMKSLENYVMPTNWICANFRLRLMHSGRSFLLVTEIGFIFEYLYKENIWVWVKHDRMTPMRGALANFNTNLFLADTHGSLILREQNGDDFIWTNCTSMQKGRKIKSGPPWDQVKASAANAVFFVSTSGRLLQFTVARRKFKWKDCKHPQNIKLACIVDHEILRDNIIFVVGRNGRLYQYNKVTQLWHEHYQSQHLVLSGLPGTAVRVLSQSLTGSLFMISEDGGLVEYHWNAMDGWNWIEHGKPCKSVTMASSGPCFEGKMLFLIGSDGKVYLRYLTQNTWKWKCCGYPRRTATEEEAYDQGVELRTCTDKDPPNIKRDDDVGDADANCDTKVSPTRPIPFSEDTVIFELQDGRLAEIKHLEGSKWAWSRIIGTPTSQCKASY